jgi:hypothetical protein
VSVVSASAIASEKLCLASWTRWQGGGLPHSCGSTLDRAGHGLEGTREGGVATEPRSDDSPMKHR